MDKLRSSLGFSRDVRNDGDSGLLDPMALDSSLLAEESGDAENDGVGARSRRVRPVGGSRAAARSANEEALAKQMRNQELFKEDLRREEEQIYSEIRARKIIEEEDRKLAQRLQDELGAAASSMRIQVSVVSFCCFFAACLAIGDVLTFYSHKVFQVGKLFLCRFLEEMIRNESKFHPDYNLA